MDAPCANAVQKVATACASFISGPNYSESRGAVVMGGCGTSGRIAYLVAVRFNQILLNLGVQDEVFAYACAGGDSALLLSDEMPEVRKVNKLI